MATISMSYSAAKTVTITMNNKAANVWQQSAVVDNTTDLFVDALLGGSIQAGTTPAVNGQFEIYVYGTFDGTTYTAGCSGSDAVYTADGEEDELRFLTTITVDATSDQDYVFGPVSVAQAFGGALPSKWGVVFRNNTSVTTNATGTNNMIKFIGTKYVSA
jgi:hypothetical protein